MDGRNAANGRNRPQPPRWPDGAGRIRVLVEHPEPGVCDILGRELRGLGYNVLACTGPLPGSGHAVACPLLCGETCPAVDGADVVVTGLPVRDVTTQRMLRRMQEQRPDLQIIAEASAQVVTEHVETLVDAHTYPLRSERLAVIIDAITR